MASSAVSPTAKAPILGDKAPLKPPAPVEILLRPARLSDAPIMGKLSRDAYDLNAVTYFLTPKARDFPEDCIRNHRQTIRRRFFNPRFVSIVAYLPSDPATPVGFGQFCRLGNDEGAKQFIRDRGLHVRIWMFVLSWFFHFYHLVENMIYPDRITDKDAMKEFDSWVAEDDEIHWKSHPERHNRWHASSIIVSPHMQGKGVGRRIMTEGMILAQRERVIMGLTASIEGEWLYRKLGFELLGRFTHEVPQDGHEVGTGGGRMIWYPEGTDPKR
ncbi:hypothetical protein LSUE1_G002442 [Lachnellula suecica]|uniref:N-acetyltransferase domain-containing protein n=1 Tax=Lachnellula suecica TaxID=602035 RepID=A0A8T9CA74_9HELO|nr:hypothetical protein LSUE1_G002442 [Lachnellula suecica]